MGGLLTSLFNTARAMQVYDRQLATVQNNIANASTPGYVRQIETVEASPFQLDVGLAGGINPGVVISARSDYAEETVRRQQSLLGQADQKATDLAQLEPQFSLTSPYNISNSITGFFQSFSQLSVNPNDTVARQTVIDRAGALASAFNQTADGLRAASNQANTQIRSTVDTVNRLAGELRDINETRRESYQSQSDAGLDARVHATLEELSQYANFTTIEQPDGTFTLYLGGQVPLVVGAHQYPVQGDFSTPTTKILDANGTDVSSRITSGKLAGLLEETNQILPSYESDLNALARGFADQVNYKLQSGVDSSGAAPTVDLFAYNSTVGEAASLSVTGIRPDQIAAALPGAPGGNGNALDLAGMAGQRLLNGYTFVESFGNLGARVGRDLSTASEQKQTQSSMVAQAHSLRDQLSGVDINEEAAKLLEIQRAYQATGKVLSVLNTLTDTIIGLIH